MSRGEGTNKRRIALLLAGWPAAVLVGWLLAELAGAKWFFALCPVVWLILLFCVLRRESGK